MTYFGIAFLPNSATVTSTLDFLAGQFSSYPRSLLLAQVYPAASSIVSDSECMAGWLRHHGRARFPSCSQHTPRGQRAHLLLCWPSGSDQFSIHEPCQRGGVQGCGPQPGATTQVGVQRHHTCAALDTFVEEYKKKTGRLNHTQSKLTPI